MSRARSGLIAVLSAAGLAGCGAGETTTVVVTAPAPAPPASTEPAAPAVPEATATTDATATTAAPPAPVGPVANLPAGAVAVQGRFVMKIVKENGDFVNSGELQNVGEERDWTATTRCETRCVVEVRRELDKAGFETVQIEQEGDDPRTLGSSRTVRGIRYCYGANQSFGIATKRLAVRITGVEDRDGQPTATRLQGYFKLRQKCAGFPGKGNVVFRGALVE